MRDWQSESFWISIHAPAKGATSNKCREKRSKDNFNPRSREGSDHNISPVLFCISHFNPRSREGSDLTGRYSRLPYRKISIHAPAKGATLLFCECGTAMSIFQSTLPRRERLFTPLTPMMDVIIFQSTLPRRERLFLNLNVIYHNKFQSTLPRRERPVPGTVPVHPANFNPRSREGSDSNIIQQISFSLYNTVYFVSNNIK